MTQLLSIAAGGAIGALLRFWVSTGVYTLLGRGFPYGTLVVNVAGSLAMGLLFVLFMERVTISAEWRAAILIGLLGSFTTFSTFSLETLNRLLVFDHRSRQCLERHFAFHSPVLGQIHFAHAARTDFIGKQVVAQNEAGSLAFVDLIGLELGEFPLLDQRVRDFGKRLGGFTVTEGLFQRSKFVV